MKVKGSFFFVNNERPDRFAKIGPGHIVSEIKKIGRVSVLVHFVLSCFILFRFVSAGPTSDTKRLFYWAYQQWSADTNPADGNNTGKHRKHASHILRCHLILKMMIILPRQARDKHRESTQKSVPAFPYVGIGMVEMTTDRYA